MSEIKNGTIFWEEGKFSSFPEQLSVKNKKSDDKTYNMCIMLDGKKMILLSFIPLTVVINGEKVEMPETNSEIKGLFSVRVVIYHLFEILSTNNEEFKKMLYYPFNMQFTSIEEAKDSLYDLLRSKYQDFSEGLDDLSEELLEEGLSEDEYEEKHENLLEKVSFCDRIYECF